MISITTPIRMHYSFDVPRVIKCRKALPHATPIKIEPNSHTCGLGRWYQSTPFKMKKTG